MRTPYFFYGCIALIMCSRACASEQPDETLQPRIINGTEARVEDTKHLVSIRLKKYDRNFGSGHICGGSLIAPNKVLTAAHCLYNSSKRRYRLASEFVVVMGTLNRYERNNGTIVSEVSSLAYMNTFSPDSMRDDVGVMFLRQGVPGNGSQSTVSPIELATQQPPAGAQCQVAGWGRTEKATLSNVLLLGNVSTIRSQTCGSIYGNGMLPGMLCAGRLQGGTDSCQGDSGGPLMHQGRVIGVVSWGYGCAEPGLPGVYSDIQYYHQWILERSGNSSTRLAACLWLWPWALAWTWLVMCRI